MDPFQTKFHICLAKKPSDPGQQIRGFPKCKSHHLAILINIWHIWEDRSQKVNNDEPDLRFFHGNFWPVISHAVRKPCPRGGVQVSPVFLEAPNLWVRCRRRFIFHKKKAPYFWKPLTCGYVAQGVSLPKKKRAPDFWKPLTCGYVAQGCFS